MKLHLGCGKRFIPGWVHIDHERYEHIDHCCDLDNLHFIEDDSVDLIYASHVLEYYDWEDAIGIVLPEWKRVLKPGGILRLAVPNMDAIMPVYKMTGNDINKIIGALFGKIGYNESKIYHKCVYNSKKMYEILAIAGFRNIHHWNWHETEHAAIDDFSQAYYPHMDKTSGHLISLNIECIK